MIDVSHAQFDRALEALIFAAEAPVAAAELVRAYGTVTGLDVLEAEVEAAVSRLNVAYQESGRAFRIHHWGGGYRMATVDDVAPFVKSLFAQEEERRLSRSLLETLAIVAYRQPVSKPEIDFVRGVNSDYALSKLMEREFITIVARSESVGRPLLYGTTEAFLDQFGLGTLDELPRPREIDELLTDPAFSRERATLMSEMPSGLDTSNGSSTEAPGFIDASEQPVIVEGEAHG